MANKKIMEYFPQLLNILYVHYILYKQNVDRIHVFSRATYMTITTKRTEKMEDNLSTRDGRAGLFCHRAGLERAGLIFVQPGWAGLATTHKNRAAGFFPSINWLFVLQVLFFTANDRRKLNLNKKGVMKYFLGGPGQGIGGSQGFILPHLEMVS